VKNTSIKLKLRTVLEGVLIAVGCSLLWVLRDPIIEFLLFRDSFILWGLQLVLLIIFIYSLFRRTLLACAWGISFIILSWIAFAVEVDRLSDIAPSPFTDSVYLRKLERQGILLPTGSYSIHWADRGGVFWDGIAVHFYLPRAAVNRLRAAGLLSPFNHYGNSEESLQFFLFRCGKRPLWWQNRKPSWSELMSVEGVFTTLGLEIYSQEHKASLEILQSGDARGYICTANG
jgi:hypothetical protein